MTYFRSMGTLGLAALVLLSACRGADDVHAQAGQSGQARQQVRAQFGGPTEIDTTTAFRLSSTFRAAAERAMPSVVYIQVMSEGRPMATRGGQGQVPEEWRRFFNFPFNAPDSDPGPQLGAGSGFFIDSDGHIMTNHHVVQGATRIQVRLVDGREYEATLVGSDPNTDVAIIKVEPRRGETLPVAAIGDSDDARIGDWVIALGNPLGLEFTVTAGIVSARGRQLRRGGINPNDGAAPPLEAYIQTDAAINPGNSGGPLVDLYGRVIGMNTAISAQNFIGHGFAVPSNIARRIADDILRHGYVRRPRIGVTIQDVNAVDAEVYGLSSIRGALIQSVQAGQPGEQAGLRPGDVVLKIDGRDITNATDLTTTLAQRQPGEQLEFIIWRDGRQSTVRVRLGEFSHPNARTASTSERTAPAERIGFTVAPVTADEAARMGLPRQSGLVIDQVAATGPAAGRVTGRPNLPGRASNVVPHMLKSINGREVRTQADFDAVVRRLNAGDAVSLRVIDRDLGDPLDAAESRVAEPRIQREQFGIEIDRRIDRVIDHELLELTPDRARLRRVGYSQCGVDERVHARIA
jgi:serine protease Do